MPVDFISWWEEKPGRESNQLNSWPAKLLGTGFRTKY